jgi:hypothetical protein
MTRSGKGAGRLKLEKKEPPILPRRRHLWARGRGQAGEMTCWDKERKVRSITVAGVIRSEMHTPSKSKARTRSGRIDR